MHDNDKEHDTQHEQDYFEPVVTVIYFEWKFHVMV